MGEGDEDERLGSRGLRATPQGQAMLPSALTPHPCAADTRSMEISNSGSPLVQAAEVAVQKLVLDTSRTDGASLVNLIASAAAGSLNSSTQGRFLDARA